jgi:hypothetical protein
MACHQAGLRYGRLVPRGIRVQVAGKFIQKRIQATHETMAMLDGLRRAIDDEQFASKLQAKHSKITDPKILAENYQQGLRVWNKDMTIDPSAIRVVLENSGEPSARGAGPSKFYDTNEFVI